MGYQNISVIMSQADIDSVKASIANMNSKLNFLVTLNAGERRGRIKLGPKSVDFVQDASLIPNSFPAIVPSSFDKGEYLKDTTLFTILSDFKTQVDSLKEKLDNTYLAVGSEAMVGSLELYSYVRTAADRTPGLKSVADKLKDRFRRQPYKKRVRSQV